MRAEVLWIEVPSELRSVLEPYVLKHGHLLPMWCAHVSFRVASGEDTFRISAQAEPEFEYRQLRFHVGPAFLTETPKNRERTVIHEFYHSHLQPVRSYVDEILTTFVEDEPTRKLLFEQYHKYEEGVVQDMTLNVLPPVPPKRK